ncbi:MAG: hypothetical protein ACXVHN_07745 [Methanobacterium sp.]
MNLEPIIVESNIYQLPPQKVYSLLKTCDEGLSESEAKKGLKNMDLIR